MRPKVKVTSINPNKIATTSFVQEMIACGRQCGKTGQTHDAMLQLVGHYLGMKNEAVPEVQEQKPLRGNALPIFAVDELGFLPVEVKKDFWKYPDTLVEQRLMDKKAKALGLDLNPWHRGSAKPEDLSFFATQYNG
jgi:hypothetical protein